MTIEGFNVFGSLTVNGKRLTFKDFDTNNDGKISEEEFESLLQKEECDTLELSSLDTDDDKIVTEEEFSDFEKKIEIQEALNALQATIAKDFTGNLAQYAQEVISALRFFAKEFVDNYTGKGDMVADFKAVLPAKYEEIKTNILNNTPEAKAKREAEEKQRIMSETLDNLYEQLLNQLSAQYPDLAAEIANDICKSVEASVRKFVNNYTGISLETDLEFYLYTLLTETETSKMADAIKAYEAVFESLGGYKDNNDLALLKKAAKEFILTAYSNGIILTLNGRNLTTSASIDTALKRFTDADALNEAMKNLISSLSNESLQDSIINPKVGAKTAAEEKAFKTLKGESVHVESGILKSVPGYYNNETVTVKKQGKDGAKDDAVKLLEDYLKEQFRAQVKADLVANGVSEDKLDQVFENVFTQSAWEAADACVSGKHSTAFRHSSSSFNTKDLVDKFIEIFNTNIANAINEMNASNTDMDLLDIDWSQSVTDENGDVDSALEAALESGTTIRTNNVQPNSDTITAEKMIDRMRTTMMAKAQAMCKANGVTFNNDIFKTLFDKAKEYSIAQNVNGGINNWGAAYSTINPQKLLKDFSTYFKESYTAWVNGEKNKTNAK